MNGISKSIALKRGDEMRIGFIGAGKVGFTLGKYMTVRGADVSGYYSLYRDQTIVYSKYKARYINRHTRV